MDFVVPMLLALFAGLSTTIGALFAFFIKKPKMRYLSFAMGFSAGVMLFVSFAELLPQALAEIGELYTFTAFFLGMAAIFVIDSFIPHAYEQEKCADSRLLKCGTLLAIGIAIHNFPEGIAVFFSSLSSLSLGIPVALAVAFHNIPEGIAVSLPIFYATKSRKKAFTYASLSGLAEPLGAVIGFIFLFSFLNAFTLSLVLAAVAGVMVFISFDELLPYSYKNHSGHLPIFGIILGMGLMALSLILL